MAVCVMGFGVPYVNAVADNNCVITASAENEADYTEGTYELLTYKNYGDYIEISKCDKSATEVVIPSEIDGVPVTIIGNRAFYYCKDLTSVIIPDSVTGIGNSAFEYCENLKSVIIPDSVTNIGDRAFFNCTNLTSLKIPDSVTSIGVTAFYYCESLTSINIPDNLTSISVGEFYGCTNLKSINVSENNKYYSETEGVLFNKDKTELVRYPIGKDSTKYIIPDSVIEIGASAFSGCSNLTEIIIHDRVTSIGYNAFANCKNLSSIKIPDSVTTVGVNTFVFCTSLKSVELSSNIEKIPHEMFYKCSSLESVYIPDSVTEIGYCAFTFCTNLKEIHIPSSVEKIYCDCFSYCESLKEISLPDSVTEWHIFAESEYYGEGGIGTTFGQFFGCSSLESVKISNGLNSISYQDFGNCLSLKSIVIPESIESIGNYAFMNSNAIEKITFLNPECNISSEAAITRECVIYGYENSTAQEYAEKCNINFVSLGKAPEKETATGDLNGNGSVNIADAVLLQEYILGRYTLT
ncbi:MAG: leucine-rich repeat protein, partial [Ruminococcus sp.]|nr:leucine-rich repeat protein [Ruminococcus sp.]